MKGGIEMLLQKGELLSERRYRCRNECGDGPEHVGAGSRDCSNGENECDFTIRQSSMLHMQ